MNSFHCMMKTKGRQYWGREEKVMTIVCNFDACNERKKQTYKKQKKLLKCFIALENEMGTTICMMYTKNEENEV